MPSFKGRTGIDVREYGKVLFKRRWTMAAFFIIIVTVVTIGTFMQAPIYRSTAMVQIMPEAPNIVEFKEIVALGSGNYWAMKEYYETQFRIIKSRQVAKAVLDDLNLREVQPYKTAKDAESVLIDQITVEPVKNSQLVAIHAEDPNPEMSMKLANGVAVVYSRQNITRKQDTSESAKTWLDVEKKQQEDRLQKSEVDLLAYTKETQIFSFDEKFNIALKNLANFSEALAEAKRKRIEAESLYSKCMDLKKIGQAMMIPPVVENQLIQDLKSSQIQAEKELAQIASQYGPKHPKVEALEKQIQLLGEKIAAEVENTLGSINAAYLVAKNRETEMAKAVGEARAEAQDMSEKETRYKVLKRDADANQNLYEELQKRAKETEITKNLAANNIQIIEEARLPEHHIKPRRKVNILLGMMLGILGGIGLAFFMEYIDNTIKTQQDIETVTDTPFLGIIPSFQAEPGTVVDDLFCHHNPKSSITESCRAIRTNITYSSPGRELKKFLVTSAGPQEGKSTTVINMGIIFAQGGRRVCLVDSDLRRPRLHKAFQVDRNHGLTNYVMGEITIDDAVVTTEVPNLFLVPSGPIPPNPSEMLGSPRMQEIIKELEGRFDMVLFDSPPIVAVTDAVVLSKSVDGVLLVVKAGKTTTDMFGRALRQFEDVKAQVTGTVLNDFNLRGEGYRYYYYYHYYRSDDGATDKKRVRKRQADDAKKNA